MSQSRQPKTEIKSEDNKCIVNAKFDNQFTTSEGSSLKEAIDRNDGFNLEEGRDIVVEDKNRNFGVGSNTHTAMIQYLMKSMDMDKEEAICSVLKPKVDTVFDKDDSVEVVVKPNHRVYGENVEEALVEYYKTELI